MLCYVAYSRREFLERASGRRPGRPRSPLLGMRLAGQIHALITWHSDASPLFSSRNADNSCVPFGFDSELVSRPVKAPRGRAGALDRIQLSRVTSYGTMPRTLGLGRRMRRASAMNGRELEQILTAGESDRVEFTVSLADKEKFSEAVFAFANDMPNSCKPGYLFVGANTDGSASGAFIDDQLLQNLAAIRSDGHIQPLPAMTVEKWRLRGGDMAVIEAHPSDLPPVRYKGRIHIRVGPRRDREPG